MSGLIYEVAWVRSLELIFGTTTFAVATVLAAFMGGLACGSYVMGTQSSRFGRFHPLVVYAVLESLIAVMALAIPFLLNSLVPAYQFVWKSTHASFIVFSLIRFALSALVLLVPTALMGATLPVVSEFVNRQSRLGEKRIGLLYAFNTLGAVLGCAAAGLLLFPSIGLARTQWVAVGLNLVAAIGGLVLARHSRHKESCSTSDAQTEPSPMEWVQAPAARKQAAILVSLYAASGLVAMLYEVAWSRVLVLVLGSSTYAYTIMLTTFLLGLALGAWLATRWLKTSGSPLLAAGFCQLGIALATCASIVLVEEMPFLYLKSFELFNPTPQGLLRVQFLLAGGLMILPTLGLGAMFPITINGLNPAGNRTARTVGWAYALNTLGAITGSVLAGFWLVPRLGSQNTLLNGVAINTLLGLVALAFVPAGLLRRHRVSLAGLLLLLGAAAFQTTPRWDAAVLSSGMFRYVRDYVGLSRDGFRERARKIAGEMLQFEEGLTCTVTVFRNPECRSLLVNGKPDASTPSDLPNPFDTNAPARLLELPTQVLLGHVPLLLAPHQDQVLLIGLGSGITLGSALTHPVKHLECIELEQAVVRASGFFEDFNHRPLSDPRVELIVNDARNHLVVTDQKYDVIMSEPSNPWIPGAANLFTREFFATSRGKLKPEGIFCQWIQLYEIQSAHFEALLRTFQSIFPDTHLFRVDSDAILVGSQQPLPIDERALRSRMTPEVRQDLARIQIRNVEDFLGRYWIGGDELKRGLSPGLFNTDDNMLIEFAAPLRVLAGRGGNGAAQQTIAALFDGKTRGAIPHVTLMEPSLAADFWAGVSEATLRYAMPETLVYADHSLKLRHNARAAAVRGATLCRQNQPAAGREVLDKALIQFPDSPELHRAMAQLCSVQSDWAGTKEHAEKWLSLASKDPLAQFYLGLSLFHLKQTDAALTVLEGIPSTANSMAELRPFPYYLGSLYAQAGRHEQAVSQFQAFLRRDPAHVEARVQLAEALHRSGHLAEAAIEWQRIAQLNANQAVRYQQEAADDWNNNRRAEAAAKLAQARQLDPSSTDIAVMLARVQVLNGQIAAAAETLGKHLSTCPDRPAAVGYLSQILARQNRTSEARLLAARYRTLTGRIWADVED